MPESANATQRDRPRHPFWCDDCGGKAPFTIRGCRIKHDQDCRFYGETDEKAEKLWAKAVAWLKAHPGEEIP